MAAKASRTYTLFLLVALTVASLTATVTVSPCVVSAGTTEPTLNGDPDRPNDAPKPTTQPSSASSSNRIQRAGGSPVSAMGGERESMGWSWAMSLIAPLLGRYGL